VKYYERSLTLSYYVLVVLLNGLELMCTRGFSRRKWSARDSEEYENLWAKFARILKLLWKE
jgi:hypothetical protein